MCHCVRTLARAHKHRTPPDLDRTGNEKVIDASAATCARKEAGEIIYFVDQSLINEFRSCRSRRFIKLLGALGGYCGKRGLYAAIL